MPLGELSVPSYLVPPSPVQRQQLELEREQLKDRQRERASQQLMRAVGIARMNKETQDLINQGVDETTARKRAFLNNAQLVMPPNSDISHFITQDEAQEVRRDTATMLNNFRLLNLQRQENDLDERKRLHDQIFERQARELELKADKAKSDQERQALDGQVKMLELQRKASKDQIDAMDRELNRQQRAADAEANRVSRESEGKANRESREQIAGENTRLRMQQAMDKDEELKSLVSARDMERLNLRSAQDKVGKWWGAPSKDQLAIMEKRVKDAEDAIEARRRQIRDEYSGKTTPAPVGEGVGDNNLPDKQTGRVRVKSPDGRIGTLPADQVDAALKAGWTKL